MDGQPGVAAPRLGTAVVVTVLSCVFAVSAYDVLAHVPAPAGLAALALTAAGLALAAVNVVGVPVRRWRLALAVQAVLAYLPVLLWPQARTLWGLIAFLGCACLVRLRAPWSWTGFAVASGSSVPVIWWTEPTVPAVCYGLVFTATLGYLFAVLAWLHRLAVEMPLTEARLTAVEVARERRRLLRDAHDVLGFRLSAIVLNLELTRRAGPPAAGRALREAGDQAAAALAEIEALTADRPGPGLAAELTAARALLARAGVAVVAPPDVAPLAADDDAALALVLREAVTNVLRHGTGGPCTIALRSTWRRARLVVTGPASSPATAPTGGNRPHNPPPATAPTGGNGPRNPPPAPARTGGNGLRNLTERVTALGGRLGTTVRGGEFRLTAEVPVHRYRGPDPTTLLQTTGGTLALVGLYLSALVQLPADARTLAPALVFGAGLLHLCRPRTDARRPRAWAVVLAGQVLLAYLPLVQYPPDAWVLRHYVGGMLLVLVRGRLRWPAAAAALAAEVAIALGTGNTGTLAYHLAADVDDTLLIFAVVQLPLLAGALIRGRAELAAAEVARERTRFTDRLGDHLGARLAEVTRVLTGPEPGVERALALARAAADDVRTVAAHDVRPVAA
ncbi:histidine kinase [Dactylosporangium siamense]|uniref:histidine kinase n=1 Tax=Dactylosporangium siamense TaxID=685454 RepID=UPI003621C11F